MDARSADAPAPPRALPAPPDLFGHPRGLWVLAGTELWERISFHGMQALLVLYMTGTLLLPGHVEHILGFAGYRAVIGAVFGPLSITALAAQTFGIYIGLIYFTPIIGGWIGDRWTGRRVAVVIGGLLMTAGHFALAFDASFLIALLLLILGAGMLRGNLAPQIAALYAEGDRREADAFQLYYIGLNLGAFIAPVVTGLLAKYFGYHFGFGFAGVGMLTGLVIYRVWRRFLPADRPHATRDAPNPRLTRQDRRNLVALALTMPVGVCFWTAQSQVWNVYNLWVRDHIQLKVGSFVVPVPWLSALDGLAPVLLVPPFIALWRWQAARGREPDDLTKMAIGCLVFAGGTAWLAAAGTVAGADGRAPLIWAVAFHLISNVGWLYWTPINSALFAGRAPVHLRSTIYACSSLTVFVASIVSGRLGVLYDRVTPATFWLVHAAIVAGGGILLLMLAPALRRLFAGDEEAAVR